MNSSRVNSDGNGDLTDWISQAEAARIRGISQERIRQLVQSGRLQSMEVAGRKLVRRSEVEAFVANPSGRPPKETTGKTDTAKKGTAKRTRRTY
ncbi:helix-turn-helix domain-containing protein [Terriglobus roseus]|uniref:helix-turn-helix domain-containing protein n=1 Tax=Terriglobus roseus TaxID=392734 RepID=UPI0011149AD9